MYGRRATDDWCCLLTWALGSQRSPHTMGPWRDSLYCVQYKVYNQM